MTFETNPVNVKVYYNPVDEEWRQNKCTSLGLTYKDPFMKRTLIFTMNPVDTKESERFLYLTLAKAICHNRSTYIDLFRNNLNVS